MIFFLQRAIDANAMHNTSAVIIAATSPVFER